MMIDLNFLYLLMRQRSLHSDQIVSMMRLLTHHPVHHLGYLISCPSQVRCSRFLYTLVVPEREKAEKLKQSLPPGLAVKELKWALKFRFSQCHVKPFRVLNVHVQFFRMVHASRPVLFHFWRSFALSFSINLLPFLILLWLSYRLV